MSGFPWKSGNAPSLTPELPTAVHITMKQQVLLSCFLLWPLRQFLKSSLSLEDCLLLEFFWIVCLFPCFTVSAVQHSAHLQAEPLPSVGLPRVLFSLGMRIFDPNPVLFLPKSHML